MTTQFFTVYALETRRSTFSEMQMSLDLDDANYSCAPIDQARWTTSNEEYLTNIITRKFANCAPHIFHAFLRSISAKALA